MIAPARVAAFHILSTVASGRTSLPAAVVHARTSLPDERDRALAAEIATGVQRWRAAIDWLIAHFSARRLDRLDADVLEILRLSVYQLLHLTRVPPSAVVDDAVELAKQIGKGHAGGFVNALLRTISRNLADLPLPRPPRAPGDREAAIRYLGTTLSHPDWLAARWYDRLGFDAAQQWMTFNNTPAAITLRVNRLLITPEDLVARLAAYGVVVSPGRFAPDALTVETGRPLQHPALEGLFVAQDEASQLVTLLAGPSPGRLVLDTCAAPGGKATALAATLGRGGRVVACDLRARRIALLRRTLETTRAHRVLLLRADLTRPLPLVRAFDCVIVDAPCSGLGTLRRDPDIRWRRREADLAGLAAAQSRMLRQAADVVVPGGRLIYATCSSEPEENEQVADAFLDESRDFRGVDASGVHPALPSAVIDAQGYLRTSPSEHRLEAFFGAVFERVR